MDAAVVGIPDKENGEVSEKAVLKGCHLFVSEYGLLQVPRAFVVLRPGFEETEENLRGLMESRLSDHERIRGGLFFIRSIPRDENWKVLRDVLREYQPISIDDVSMQKFYRSIGLILNSFPLSLASRTNPGQP